jgi:elongation factor Ts
MERISILKKLRAKTQLPLNDCKKALEKANWDIKKAEEILKEENKYYFEKRKEKKAKEGTIGVYLHFNGKVGAMVKLNCETDFVARNSIFKSLAHDLAMQIASSHSKTKEELLNEPFIKDPKIKVKELLEEAIRKFGENIQLEDFIKFEI